MTRRKRAAALPFLLLVAVSQGQSQPVLDAGGPGPAGDAAGGTALEVTLDSAPEATPESTAAIGPQAASDLALKRESKSASVTSSQPLLVEVPLGVPSTYLEARAAALLELDAQGQGELRADECNYLELSDLRLQPGTLSQPEGGLRDERAGRGGVVMTVDDQAGAGQAVGRDAGELLLDVAVRAHGGVRVFGRCRGPAALSGRVLVALRPRADDSGMAVVFDSSAAEFRADDGAETLLTRPSRLLADAVLVPRLQDLGVDVARPLADIDALLEQFLGEHADGTPPLAAGGRLQQVTAIDPGLRVQLAFAFNEVPEASPPAPAREPALSADEQADMETLEDALDGFMTLVVRDLAPRLASRDQQLELLALMIDLRMDVATLLLDDAAPGGGADPLRVLFLDSWARLAAILQGLRTEPGEAEYALRLASFLAAGDALRLVDDLGPAFGIEITRDGLLRLARMLLAGDAPRALTPLPTAEDARLQSLFGFNAARAVPATVPAPVAWYERLNPLPRAYAREPAPALLLREIFPRRDNLDLYLGVVSRLIDETLDQHWQTSRLTAEQRDLFEPLVRATAWKETCWRHYLPADEGVTVIRSGVGAVGMMQIVGRVWRSLFDLERLEEDVAYNVAAGIDILDHYFIDYAVRRGESEHPGGVDNLVRATYAAYNGGPSKLSRYRREDAPARARAVDDQFYRQYIVMRDEPWPRQSRCYARG